MTTEPDSDEALENAAATAWGVGLTTAGEDGAVLDCWYPAPALGTLVESAATADEAWLGALAVPDDVRRVRRSVVRTAIDLSDPPADAADAYLRLHLLSHRLVAPHGPTSTACSAC